MKVSDKSESIEGGRYLKSGANVIMRSRVRERRTHGSVSRSSTRLLGNCRECKIAKHGGKIDAVNYAACFFNVWTGVHCHDCRKKSEKDGV